MFAACRFTHGEVPGDGNPNNVPDAGMCTSLTSECIGDTLRYCKEVGGTAIDMPCGWGCEAGNPARCLRVVPSGSGGVEMNGVTPADVTGEDLLDVTLEDGVILDGDVGRIGTTALPDLHHNNTTGIDKGIDFQFRGPISMWRFRGLTINGTVSLIGKRPIALVVDGEITINGVLDARGGCATYIAGPGGGSGGSNESQAGFTPPPATMGGGSGGLDDSGGGGGGHGDKGGSGENTAGGKPYGDQPITVLIGGAGGGAGGGGGSYGRGGGGGGALQIISNTRITIVSPGGINAGGCGGKPGTGGADSGGGGGAGGAILLEAPIVMINGTLAANGGGGGGGGGGTATAGTNGILGTMTAAGGVGATNEAGDPQFGGSGGATGTPAQLGGTGANPGGGGGGIGRIRINTRAGSGAMVGGATLSPGPTDPQYSADAATIR
jgi:hypothetical protein